MIPKSELWSYRRQNPSASLLALILRMLFRLILSVNVNIHMMSLCEKRILFALCGIGLGLFKEYFSICLTSNVITVSDFWWSVSCLCSLWVPVTQRCPLHYRGDREDSGGESSLCWVELMDEVAAANKEQRKCVRISDVDLGVRTCGHSTR